MAHLDSVFKANQHLACSGHVFGQNDAGVPVFLKKTTPSTAGDSKIQTLDVEQRLACRVEDQASAQFQFRSTNSECITPEKGKKTFGRFALGVILVGLLTHQSGLLTNQLLKQHGRAAFDNGPCLLILTRVHRCQGMHRWSESLGKSASVQWKRASLTASSQHLDESTDTAPTVTKPSPGKCLRQMMSTKHGTLQGLWTRGFLSNHQRAIMLLQHAPSIKHLAIETNR